MYKKSLLPMIVDSYDSFTSVEKAIADYFLSNNQKADFSSKAMKERLFVSEASLSRFAKKLGFKGYREFIYRYEEGFFETDKPASFEFQEVLELYHSLLDETKSYVNEEQIKSFCEKLCEAKHVIVLGIGSSGLAAKEMKFRFMRLGVMMEALEKSDEMKMQSVILGNDSLAIGISLSGRKEEVVFSLKKAAQGGAKTVLITANQNDDFSIPSVDSIVCEEIEAETKIQQNEDINMPSEITSSEEISSLKNINQSFSLTSFASCDNVSEIYPDAIVEGEDGVFSISNRLGPSNFAIDEAFKQLVDSVIK